MWNFVKIQRCPFFCPSNTDLAIVFFLTREIKLVIIYCHDVNDDYDHLFTRCTRCPPACLCVHERSDDSMTEWRWCDEDEDDIRSVCVIATMLNVFLSFLSMRDSWESLVCFGLCVCVWCGCFWTLICSSQGSELMVIWRLAFERESECVDVLCVCVWLCDS